MSYMTTFVYVNGKLETFENSPFNSLGRRLSAFKKFDDSHYPGTYITYVYVGLRRIGKGFFSSMKYLGANHWSVIMELSNGKYACVQLDTTGKIDLQVYNTLRAASLSTWGRSSTVRLSCYGSCHYYYNRFVDSLYGPHWYILLFNDCQNFARQVVAELTGKTVGVFPIEDGPEFSR